MPKARISFAIVLFYGVLAAPSGLAGEIYQWRDEAGRLHVTDDVTKVPPKLRRSAARKLEPPDSSQGNTGKAVPRERSEGARIWEKKCAACHHTGTGEIGEKLGLGQLAIHPETRFLRRPEELLPRLKYATDGRTTDMPEVEISEDELLAVARFLVSSQRPQGGE